MSQHIEALHAAYYAHHEAAEHPVSDVALLYGLEIGALCYDYVEAYREAYGVKGALL